MVTKKNIQEMIEQKIISVSADRIIPVAYAESYIRGLFNNNKLSDLICNPHTGCVSILNKDMVAYGKNDVHFSLFEAWYESLDLYKNNDFITDVLEKYDAGIDLIIRMVKFFWKRFKYCYDVNHYDKFAKAELLEIVSDMEDDLCDPQDSYFDFVRECIDFKKFEKYINDKYEIIAVDNWIMGMAELQD